VFHAAVGQSLDDREFKNEREDAAAEADNEGETAPA